MSNLTENNPDNAELDKLFNDAVNDKTPSAAEANASSTSASESKPEEKERATEVATEQTQTPSKAAADDKLKENATEPQWIDKLTDPDVKKQVESLMAERERLHNNWKAEQGRTAAALRERKKLEEKLAQEAKAPPVQAKPEPQNDKLAELMAALRETDPAMADIIEGIREDAIRKAVDVQNSQLNEIVDKQIKPMHIAKEEQYAAQQKEIMDRACPNWAEVVNDPDFREYMRHQPKFAQDALESSPHASDLLYLLDKYNKDVFGAVPTQGGDPSVKAPSEAEVIKQRRDAKLHTSVAPSNVATVKQKAEPSNDELLDKLFKDALSGAIA